MMLLLGRVGWVTTQEARAAVQIDQDLSAYLTLNVGRLRSDAWCPRPNLWCASHSHRNFVTSGNFKESGHSRSRVTLGTHQSK